eukprot:1803244-Rhodomonas_salina.1
MPGTDLAHGTTKLRYLLCVACHYQAPLPAMQCMPLPNSAICYALPGTDLAHTANSNTRNRIPGAATEAGHRAVAARRSLLKRRGGINRKLQLS